MKYRDFLLTNTPILHPDHYLLTTCRESLFFLGARVGEESGAAGISIAGKMEAAKFGMRLLELCDKLSPGLSAERGDDFGFCPVLQITNFVSL